VALVLDSKLTDEARTYFRFFVGDCLAAIALISTVSNLKGIWMLLINMIPVGKIIQKIIALFRLSLIESLDLTNQFFVVHFGCFGY
jgi:hypothetical protein